MVLRTSFLVVAIASLSPAQGPLVLPLSHQTVEGTTGTNLPFGRSTPARVQSVYDSMLFQGVTAPANITAIAFRLDGGASAGPKQVDCEIRMSTSPRILVDTSATFADNRGIDETVVLARQILTLPAGGAAVAPSPFLAPIALDVPFAYDPLQGPLVVEVVVHAQPPGAYALDATFVCNSPEIAVGPVACQPAQGLPLRVESASTQLMWGRPWLVRILDAAPQAFVVLALGSSASGTWNGAPLPVDLTAAGAPGCHVSIAIVDTFFQLAQPDGTATFTFAVPNQPSLVGQEVHYQAGAAGTGLNALGIVTSQAKRIGVCGFEPVARVWSSGVTDLAGVREMGTAPVVEVTVQ